MPRNASGVYSLPAGNPVVAATQITVAWGNGTMSDLGSEMTNSLDRSGRGGMLASLKGVDGTAAAPLYSFTAEPTTGIFRAGAGILDFSALGSVRFRITDHYGLFGITGNDPFFFGATVQGLGLTFRVQADDTYLAFGDAKGFRALNTATNGAISMIANTGSAGGGTISGDAGPVKISAQSVVASAAFLARRLVVGDVSGGTGTIYAVGTGVIDIPIEAQAPGLSTAFGSNRAGANNVWGAPPNTSYLGSLGNFPMVITNNGAEIARFGTDKSFTSVGGTIRSIGGEISPLGTSFRGLNSTQTGGFSLSANAGTNGGLLIGTDAGPFNLQTNGVDRLVIGGGGGVVQSMNFSAPAMVLNQLSFYIQDNTHVVAVYKASDGVVRSNVMTFV